jgi:hypothetical protein
MLKRLLALSFLFFCLNIFAQNFVLQGIVHDAQNTPVAFSNVVLLSENVIVNGSTTADDGSFTIAHLKTGVYTLKISFLGYEPFEKEIDIASDTILEPITLKENVETLEGVTVVAKNLQLGVWWIVWFLM